MKGPLVLIGLMGSGKTSVGRELAARLGWPWVDLDAAIVKVHRRSIPEQFARDGEAKFRARESALLKRYTAPGPRVLSTGGGVVLSPANRARLKGCTCIYLQASAEALAGRLKGREAQNRPLLKGQDVRRVLGRLARKRGPLYRESATLTVLASQGSPKDVAARILARL